MYSPRDDGCSLFADSLHTFTLAVFVHPVPHLPQITGRKLKYGTVVPDVVGRKPVVSTDACKQHDAVL